MPRVDQVASDTVDDGADPDVEAVVRAARVFSAVTAESIAQAGENVTLPQLRVLTLASTHDALSNSQVADALGVHISNASRICDRLVQAGMLARRDRPSNRRQVELTLTELGTSTLAAVTDHRRAVFGVVLARLSPGRRAALHEALDALVDAAEPVLQISRAHLP